ncbi:MAG: hypothetical protein CVU99_13860 [Firmicutes bacterium HGW-Firmicutes-4]|jgi:GGDEF domain-containing protein|nr:MAG: hypothetical protein CVU99_13860 [Firmicutes bacterium HGW-Firmicutes-4]
MTAALLVERNGIIYAKTPIDVKDHHDIKFITDIKQGESVRIGYGNPAKIIKNARDIQDRVQAFNPEGIFSYSCTCRRFLLQNEVESLKDFIDRADKALYEAKHKGRNYVVLK